MAFVGVGTSSYTSEMIVPHPPSLVRNFGIGDATDSLLLRGLQQPQGSSSRRPCRPHLLAGHVHGSSYLLAHGPCPPRSGRKLSGDLDRRIGASVGSTHPSTGS